MKKASEVGSNLKKRLSMRYAEPTELGPGGFSAVPEVPSLPPVLPMAGLELKPSMHSDSHRGLSMDGAPRMPVLGDGFAEEADLDDEAYRPRGSSDTGRSGLEGYAADPAIDLNLLSREDFDPEACECNTIELLA